MRDDLTPERALMVLNALPNIGPISLQRLLSAFAGDPVAVLRADARQLKRVHGIGDVLSDVILSWRERFDPAKEEKRLAEMGGRFVPQGHPDYPPLLREIHDPPIGLYALGPVMPARRNIAIIGSRRATLYGQAVAKKLAGDLARMGFCIISGLARGIDSVAHQGALDAGGQTVAVLGCGADVIYPPENLDLYRRIAASGAILSEFPLGRRADKQTFPMRNRIVAGLCEAVIVVESDVNGGSMITAKFAADQGRTVFAVPGRIDQVSSRGCHALIRDGAVLLTGVEDVLEELQFGGAQMELSLETAAARRAAAVADASGADVEAAASPMPAGLGAEEQKLWACLCEGGTLGADALSKASGLPPQAVASALLMMELRRLVVKRADGTFEARL